MDKSYANGAVKLLSALLLFGVCGTAGAADFDGLKDSAYAAGATLGESFSDYVRTTLGDADETKSFIHTVDLSLRGAAVETFDELILAGREQIRNAGSAVMAGSASNDGGANESSDPLFMMLAALGVIIYQLRRKQRSLEQRPLSAV